MSVQTLVERLREHGLRFLCKLLALKLARDKKIDGHIDDGDVFLVRYTTLYI